MALFSCALDYMQYLKACGLHIFALTNCQMEAVSPKTIDMIQRLNKYAQFH